MLALRLDELARHLPVVRSVPMLSLPAPEAL
jgi:hypothetical protein